jgi:hypothetical protein
MDPKAERRGCRPVERSGCGPAPAGDSAARPSCTPALLFPEAGGAGVSPAFGRAYNAALELSRRALQAMCPLAHTVPADGLRPSTLLIPSARSDGARGPSLSSSERQGFQGSSEGRPVRVALLIHSRISGRDPLNPPSSCPLRGCDRRSVASRSRGDQTVLADRSSPDFWHGFSAPSSPPSFHLERKRETPASVAALRGRGRVRDREVARWHRHSKSIPTA